MKQTSNYFAVLSLDDEDEEDDTDRQFTPPSSDAPPSVGSPLIDKAPAEIRLKIFALVLQASRSVVNVSNLPPYKRGHRLSTSLFAVSRLVSAEAQEQFYKLNILRVKSLNDPYLSRKDTRNLEIVGDVVRRWFIWPGGGSSNAAVKALTQLPKIRTVSMGTDFMHEGPLPRLGPLNPIDESSNAAAKLDVDDDGLVKTLDFGVREITRRAKENPSAKLFLKRFHLIEAVAFARKQNRAATLQHLKAKFKGSGYSDPDFVNSLFVLRMACLEAWRTAEAGIELAPADQEVVDRFWTLLPFVQTKMERLFEQIPSGTRLLDVTVEQHGVGVMDLADDIAGAYLPLLPKQR